MSIASYPSASRNGTKYRTYKRATDRLAGWLVTTASKAGAGRIVNLRDSNGANQAHGLTIGQFSALTDFIVEATPKIEVPADIIDLAQTAHHCRQERAALLRGIDIESDKSHQHVITIIGDVYHKLKSHCEASKKSSKRPTPDGCFSDVVPSFQLLDVEALESEEDDYEAEGRSTELRVKLNKNQKNKLLKKKQKAKQEAKQVFVVDDDEDPYFVLMCLLADLKSVRSYIKEVWQEYKDGKTDLVTASLTTNATFDVIRTYEEDFPAIAVLLKDYSKTMELIMSRNLDSSDEGLQLFLNPCIDPALNDASHMETVGKSLATIHQIADLTLASAFYFLKRPRQVLVQRKKGKMVTLVDHSDVFGKCQAEQDRGQLSFIGRFREDVQILAAYAQQVYVSKPIPRSTPDQFTKQWLDEYAKSCGTKITLAQALGAQIYLDIQHVLRQDMSQGVFDLHKAGMLILRSHQKWNDKCPQNLLRIAPGLETTSCNLMRACNLLNSALHDKILTDVLDCDRSGCKCMDFHTVREVIRGNSSVFPFLRINPLLCGILLFQAVHHFRDHSSVVAFAYGTIQCAGQIYHGCLMQREARMLAPSANLEDEKGSNESVLDFCWKTPLVWADMDYLFELYGKEAFFDDGKVPKSNADFVDGAWTLDYIRKGIERPGHTGPILCLPRLDQEGAKREEFLNTIYSFEPIAVTHRLYYAKYADIKSLREKGEIHYEWTLETLQALLETHLVKQKKTTGKGRGKGKKKKVHETMKEADGDVSQVTILRTLKEALQSERRALWIDYLGLHITCFTFLKTVWENAISHLNESKQRLNMNENFLNFFANDILVTINTPGSESELQAPLCAANNDGIFTSWGHVIIDSIAKDFADRGCFHEQLMKTELILCGLSECVCCQKKLSTSPFGTQSSDVNVPM